MNYLQISEGFKAKQYNQCPKTSPERHQAALQARVNITDMRTVMAQTKEHRLKVLNAAAINIKNWIKQVIKPTWILHIQGATSQIHLQHLEQLHFRWNWQIFCSRMLDSISRHGECASSFGNWCCKCF